MQLITGMPTVLVLFRLSTGSFVAYWIDLLLPKTIKLVDTASLLEVQSLKGQCEAVSQLSQRKLSHKKFINLCNSLNFLTLFDIVSASMVETINSCE